MIHLQFYFDIHDSFVHDTLRLNVSNSFSHFIEYPQLNESPKLKSQEKSYRRSTLPRLYSSPHVSVVMVTTKKFVYVFRAKRCQSPRARISILEVIVFVLHTCTIKNDQKAPLCGDFFKRKTIPKNVRFRSLRCGRKANLNRKNGPCLIILAVHIVLKATHNLN